MLSKQLTCSLFVGNFILALFASAYNEVSTATTHTIGLLDKLSVSFAFRNTTGRRTKPTSDCDTNWVNININLTIIWRQPDTADALLSWLRVPTHPSSRPRAVVNFYVDYVLGCCLAILFIWNTSSWLFQEPSVIAVCFRCLMEISRLLEWLSKSWVINVQSWGLTTVYSIICKYITIDQINTVASRSHICFELCPKLTTVRLSGFYVT